MEGTRPIFPLLCLHAAAADVKILVELLPPPQRSTVQACHREAPLQTYRRAAVGIPPLPLNCLPWKGDGASLLPRQEGVAALEFHRIASHLES